MTHQSDLIVQLDEISVEIPLRGLRHAPKTKDPRIVRRRDGSYVLRALDRVSLDLRRGERIGVVGGNGNGKTTLLKLIAGLLPVASGKITVYGSIRALLTIDAGVVLALTGLENIRLHYGLLGIKSMSMPEYVDNVASFADLGAFLEMPMSIYSPGMRSRLQFAMNTVEPADLLLLDEWLGVADQAFQLKAHQRLVDYIALSEAILFASHSQALVERITERNIRLSQGRILFSDDPGSP